MNKSPVAIIVYNRPEKALIVLKQIHKYQPKELFVIADGPKLNDVLDKKKCEKVKRLINSLEWDCKVNINYSSHNLGLKKRVISGLNWVFQSVESAIILEDDCVPSEDFFSFCDEMLAFYKNNTKVGCITGVNFQDGIIRGKGSYYFSKYNHCWGWASWRRSWDLFSEDLNFWPEYKKSKDWKKKFNLYREKLFWTKHFDYCYEDDVNSWAANWTLSLFLNNSITVTPQKNLVSNIGHGIDSTHTQDSDSKYSNMNTFELKNIIHPDEIKLDIDADNYTFDNHFRGYELKFINRLIRFIKKWI